MSQRKLLSRYARLVLVAPFPEKAYLQLITMLSSTKTRVFLDEQAWIQKLLPFQINSKRFKNKI